MESNISVKDAKILISHGALLIDVRTAAEYATGHLENALNIPYREILEEILKLPECKDKEKEIVLYCEVGIRSRIARETLINAGYKKVYNAGAYKALI